ncbi:DNA polymerase III delta prime subunit [Cricetibacter osteomyelitidis]|uniref:DNA polymerase III subunit delta' n=1 Tax=Cricetibacter osteomyelitidis TaxID=1521931 RepID=A0A4R2TI53_9PAST|nr:DNA polymerase III subunit delta' [Cricetibacter osteomyelitidis]TCP96908.1 DNA polymerase III delta prime subunit [Cricetibacter osteomyelitidis]
MNPLYPWLQPQYQQIVQAFQQGHGHHSLLFKADSGLGIEQLINVAAQRILCRQADSEQPCGHCHACQLFVAQNHPDFYLLAPVENKDIGIDQVREINEKVSQHAQQNGNKVVYLQGAERLTEAAANALLKTLEEPRPNTYFLLQADLSAPLLATIYSRCQAWIFNAPKADVSLNWLQSQYQGDIADISIALQICHYRPLSALDCLQQDLLSKRKTLMAQFWRFYTRSDILQILPHFETEILFQQLDWLSGFLSDTVKAKLNIQSGWICQDFATAVQQFAERQSILTLLNHCNIIQKVRSDLRSINAVNQELILMDGLSRMLVEKG